MKKLNTCGVILISMILVGHLSLSLTYSQDVSSSIEPGQIPHQRVAAADNYVDMGNVEDEQLHNLQGWGAINPGLLPQPNADDRTSRYQTLRGSSSVELFVPQAGVAYTLVFRTEDGGADDS